MSASDGWESKEASQPAPDALYFEVMARPTEANLDALVAVGAQDIHDFSDAAITVRFSETGLVDVMDDSEYSSDGSFEYDPGVWYNIAISADVAAGTYDVEIGRCGEKRRNVRRGARFRAEANVYDRLSNWGLWSSQRAALDLSTPTWMTSGACAPATCQALGAECGQPSDGCNRTLNCGVCGGGQLCSSGACVEESASVPPPPSCTPASCQSLGAECGGPSDGCGGTLNCGGCDAGQPCFNNVCIDQPVTPLAPPPACIPTSCQALGADCGVRSDGCGGALNCGGCGAGQLCSGSVCIDQPVTPPPPPACTPTTCQALGAECGARSDGCGSTLNCGGCGAGQLCSSSVCIDQPVTPPPPPACVPDTCQAVGAECGAWSDGCGGTLNCGGCNGSDTCNNISGLCVAPVGLVWTDSIQSGGGKWGFDDLETEAPIDTPVQASDANGANLTRVPDPLGGGGYAVRHYGTLGPDGTRAQLAIWSFRNTAFEDLVTSGQPVYVAQEWYFPETLSAGGNDYPWLSLWDWHSTGPEGSARWHTAPGLMLATDGSMRMEFNWGGDSGEINGWESAQSSIGLPVGEWFDIEMKYQWTSGRTTLSVWINGQLALEQSGVQTASSQHTNVETYIKLYGADSGRTPWSPDPTVKYTRNVRISGERIWR